ncbi:MAG TPA: HlyD family efflux transporter periplasmic adaptor subunit [Clostridia bacterium]|nr:HlyD family efflux transporter periplasmic adaptor subunit [Clostridia bacterium]
MGKVASTPRIKKVNRRKLRRRLLSRGEKVVFLLIFCSLIWLAAGKAYQIIATSLVRTCTVETGSLERKLTINQALIFREEQVVLAPRRGRIGLLIQEGERAAAGAVVAELFPEIASQEMKLELVAPGAGLVSFHSDGLETVFRPDLTDTLQLDRIDFPAENKMTSDGKIVEKGERVFKIVNNLQPFLLSFIVDTEDLDSIPLPGGRLDIRVKGNRQVYSGKVVNIISKGVAGQVLLSVDRGDSLLKDRYLDLDLILESKKGLQIPSGAIAYREGTAGVYKSTSKGFRWVPVDLLFQEGDVSIVEGLNRGDRIAANPGVIERSGKDSSIQ